MLFLGFILVSFDTLPPRDGNDKTLIAGGENNIIRDYFDSSAGFHCFTKATRRLSQLSLDYRFFTLFSVLLLLLRLLQAASCLYMDHVPVKSYSHIVPERISASWILKKVFVCANFFISSPTRMEAENRKSSFYIMRDCFGVKASSR